METGELTLSQQAQASKTPHGSKNKLAENVNKLEMIETHFAVGYYLLVNYVYHINYIAIPLDWGQFNQNMPQDLELPYVYPTKKVYCYKLTLLID